MKIFGFQLGAKKSLEIPIGLQKITSKPESATTTTRPIYTFSYTGEKNVGELGPVINYRMDYESLRYRSWQAYIESDLAQIILSRMCTWIIGGGLKLQAEPSKKILQMENLPDDTNEFSEQVEARFSLYGKSTMADYSDMRSLGLIANTAYLNSIVGGDVLVVLRYVDGLVKVQLIDGSHVQSPSWKESTKLDNGNTIKYGIEIAPNGQHVGYYVCTVDKPDGEFIPARSVATGLVCAYMIYALEYRLDNVRGLPLIAAVLESIKKIERYKEATLGNAEEQAKIAYSIEHDVHSTGENPMLEKLAQNFNVDAPNDSVTIDGRSLEKTFAATTNKTAINMPIGAKVQMHENKGTLNFDGFFNINADILCATVQIPPEVAKSKYDSNFSSSRAALKDWEHTINVKRKVFSEFFYQKIYNFWLETEILKNKIQAPGYLMAKVQNNRYVIEAYRNARWPGSNVPHIDPLKEVNAERAKLGKSAESIPLTTVEAATEALNGGESDANIEQFASELKYVQELGIIKNAEKKTQQK